MKRLILAVSFLAAAACTDGSEHARAIAVLVDVSGTYTDQAPDVVHTIKTGVLPAMQPGDSMTVIRIDDASYEKDNVETRVALAPRLSEANAQKLQTADQLDAFAKTVKSASHTDVTGALMLAADYLRDAQADHKMIVIFSDLKEDLPVGTRRVLSSDELEGMRVFALNVKRLEADNRNPQQYRDRMAEWEQRATAAGAAEWRVFVDEERLVDGLRR